MKTLDCIIWWIERLESSNCWWSHGADAQSRMMAWRKVKDSVLLKTF